MSKAAEARALYQEHPDWTGAQIARAVGCSRQNVVCALRTVGILLHRRPPLPHRCSQCQTIIGNQALTELCRQCRAASHRRQRPCNECGATISRWNSRWKRTDGVYKKPGRQYGGRAFCNRSCFGRWVGKNKGWGRKRLPETPMLQALPVGQTLRVQCHWKHRPATGCGGKSWARHIARSQGLRSSLHCKDGWCTITKLRREEKP